MSLGGRVPIPREAGGPTALLTRLWAGSRGFSLFNRIFSYPAALAGGLGTVTVLTATTRFDDPDLWWHLRNGQIIWNTHTLPSTDTFSFTALGHPWVAHEWLAEMTLYAEYRYGGVH